MALNDEDRWHGSADDLARKIEGSVTELRELLGMADDILQSDEMPQPWDQWLRAIFAGQDAWSELAEGGDVKEGAMIVCSALRESKLTEWPPKDGARSRSRSLTPGACR